MQRSAPETAQTLTPANRVAVENAVRQFMSDVSRDVTEEGPAAWSKEFAEDPNFFMASEGKLAFANGAAAAQGIQSLTKVIEQIELRWGDDVRVDALTPDLAVVGATYQENRVESGGHAIAEKGYFTGVAEQRNGKWRFRDAHWSVDTAGAKSP